VTRGYPDECYSPAYGIRQETSLIDPVLVERARDLGSRAETETVARALREIVIQGEIDKAFLLNAACLADIEDVFPDGALSPQ